MPYLFSHTLVFEGSGHGFSETMWFEMPTSSLALAYANIADIKVKRAALLGAQHYVKGERVALRRTDGGVKVTRRTKVHKGYYPGNGAQASEDSNTSLQVLMTTGDEAHKKLTFMGGPYAAIFPQADSFAPAGAFTTNFNAWVALLKSQKMGWLASVVAEEKPVTGYVFDPDTGHTTYSFGGGGFTWDVLHKPKKISIEFPLSRSPLDGVQIVVPDSATVAVTAKPRPAKPYTIDGIARRYDYIFVGLGPVGDGSAGSVVPQNPVSRKRGRPLLVSVGRSPNQARW